LFTFLETCWSFTIQDSFLEHLFPANWCCVAPTVVLYIYDRDGLSFTLWDKLRVQGTESMTMNDFIVKVKVS